MRVQILAEARRELLEAKAWYESKTPGLGKRFSQAVDVALASVLFAPDSHPCVEADFRRVVLRKFPYSLIYLAKEDELFIIACCHHRKKPGKWSVRLK